MFNPDKKRAILVGVVNRGEGCAKKDSLAIYARVRYYMKWIQKTAKSGKCEKYTRYKT